MVNSNTYYDAVYSSMYYDAIYENMYCDVEFTKIFIMMCYIRIYIYIIHMVYINIYRLSRFKLSQLIGFSPFVGYPTSKNPSFDNGLKLALQDSVDVPPA